MLLAPVQRLSNHIFPFLWLQLQHQLFSYTTALVNTDTIFQVVVVGKVRIFYRRYLWPPL